MIVMKAAIKKIAIFIGNKLPIKNYVLFESCPDFSDNTKAVFDEFINRGLNKKYKLFWICFDNNSKTFDKVKNVKYVNSRLATFILTYTAKVCICCNRFIGTNKKKQKCYYLMHGSPIKNTSGYYRCPEYVDYMITSSVYMNSKSALAMGIDENKCYPLGFARNDILVNHQIDISKYFGKYNKYIIWYPTVKQQSNGIDYGIKPISFLDNDASVEVLNEFAKRKGILLIIKPHFAQIANIKISNFSNIRFINDQFYRDNNIVPYEFVGSCDALLSDYSSVFYDFMICNKPIGLVWNDLEEFQSNIGLYDFYDEVTIGCNKIYGFDDLLSFIDDVAEEKDELMEKRERTCKIVNAPRDGKNASRVVDFIVEKSKL